MEPYFECKDDLRIGVELAKRLGIDPEIIEPWSWKQEIFNQVADARVMNADGKTLEPLVTITEDDLREFEVEGVPHVCHRLASGTGPGQVGFGRECIGVELVGWQAALRSDIATRGQI